MRRVVDRSVEDEPDRDGSGRNIHLSSLGTVVYTRVIPRYRFVSFVPWGFDGPFRGRRVASFVGTSDFRKRDIRMTGGTDRVLSMR